MKDLKDMKRVLLKLSGEALAGDIPSYLVKAGDVIEVAD